MENLEKYSEQLFQGTFEKLVTSFTVTRCDGMEVHSGAGYIRQHQEKSIEVVIFTNTKTHMSEVILHRYNNKGGYILGDDSYYDISSEGGWSLNRVKVDKAIDGNLLIIRTFSNSIEVTSNFEDVVKTLKIKSYYPNTQVIYTFFEEINFPENKVLRSSRIISQLGEHNNEDTKENYSSSLCAAEVNNRDYTLKVLRDKGKTEIKIISKKPRKSINAIQEFRFLQALEFVLGRPLDNWHIKTMNSNNSSVTKFRDFKRTIYSKRPPYHFRSPDDCLIVWDQLFKKYLKFICISERQGLVNRVYELQKLSQTAYEAHATRLAIHIEGVVQTYFKFNKESNQEFDESLEEAIGNIKKNIKSPHKKTFIERLSSLKTTKLNTINVLRKLVESKVIRQDQLDAWRSCRHTLAHGCEIDFSQDIWEKIYKLITLFNFLIYHLIEYTGKYTDYGIQGFPNRFYPLEHQLVFEKVCDNPKISTDKLLEITKLEPNVFKKIIRDFIKLKVINKID